jgi:hypothetical protein
MVSVISMKKEHSLDTRFWKPHGNLKRKTEEGGYFHHLAGMDSNNWR